MLTTPWQTLCHQLFAFTQSSQLTVLKYSTLPLTLLAGQIPIVQKYQRISRYYILSYISLPHSMVAQKELKRKVKKHPIFSVPDP
jgi:hypothetical protein